MNFGQHLHKINTEIHIEIWIEICTKIHTVIHKFLLYDPAELTNRLHGIFQCEVLMNRLPVVMTPVG